MKFLNNNRRSRLSMVFEALLFLFQFRPLPFDPSQQGRNGNPSISIASYNALDGYGGLLSPLTNVTVPASLQKSTSAALQQDGTVRKHIPNAGVDSSKKST